MGLEQAAGAARVLRKWLEGPRGAGVWPKPGHARSRQRRTRSQGERRDEVVEGPRFCTQWVGFPTPNPNNRLMDAYCAPGPGPGP